MSLYYDRQGRPVSAEEWSRLHSSGLDYLKVRRDVVGQYLISTVWIGLDHNFSPTGPPLIFETMIFGPDEETSGGVLIDRYTTEEEAIKGHEETLFSVSAIETVLADVDQQGNELPRTEDPNGTV